MVVVHGVVDEGFALADIESAPSAEGGLLGLRVFAPAAGVGVAGKGIGVAGFVAEGAVEVDGLRVVAADADGGAGARRAGLVGDDVDHAAGRLVAVQHGTGAAHDFDALHAVERDRRPADAAHVDRVEALAVEQDQGIAAGGFAEAADVDRGVDAEAAVEGAHVDAGAALEHARQVARRRVADVVARDDADVGRHVGVGFAEAGGADDDRVEVGGLGLRRGHEGDG